MLLDEHFDDDSHYHDLYLDEHDLYLDEHFDEHDLDFDDEHFDEHDLDFDDEPPHHYLDDHNASA